MLTAFAGAFRSPDLRKKLLFTLGIIVVYRIGSVIPVPNVNVGQLQAAASSMATGFQNQIHGLQNQITDNRWEARGGIALALAAGALRFDDRPGKLSVAGSYGYFRGASGLAFGVGYAADRMRFNATISGSPDQGSVGGVVGGSFTLN